MVSQQVTVLVSQELEDQLSLNSTSMADLFRAQGVDAEIIFTTYDIKNGTSATRDIATTLVVSMGVIATATPLVRSIISSLTRRPVVVTELRLVPVESTSGEIIRSQDGTPVLHWVEIHQLLDKDSGARPHEEQLKLTAEAPMGIRFEIDSSSKEGRDKDE